MNLVKGIGRLSRLLITLRLLTKIHRNGLTVTLELKGD